MQQGHTEKFRLRTFWWLLPMALLLAIFVLVYVIRTVPAGSPALVLQQAEPFEAGWYLTDDPAKAPMDTLQPTGAGVSDYTHDLPDPLHDDFVFALRTAFEAVDIYVDDELVYEFGHNDALPFGNEALGGWWHLVPLHKEAKTVRFVALAQSYNISSSSYYVACLGPSSSVCLSILGRSSFTLSICALLLSVLLILMLLMLSSGVRRTPLLGTCAQIWFFILLSTIWLLTNTGFVQLLTNNMLVNYLLSYTCFMLLPVPMHQLFGTLFKRYEKVFGVLQIVTISYYLLRLILCIFFHVEFTELLMVMHLLIVVTIVVALYVAMRERSSHIARWLLMGVIGLMLGALFSLYEFYKMPLNFIHTGNSIGFETGLILLIIGLFGALLIQNRRIAEEAQQASTYRQLARTDSMTGLPNRGACDARMNELASVEGTAQLSVAMLDLNNLKLVNDTKGHAQGDELIRAAAVVIRDMLGEQTEAFRYGGDEFVVFAPNQSNADLQKHLVAFQKELTYFNQHRYVPVDIACGAVSGESLPNLSPKELLAVAEARMYDEKRRSHYSRFSENTRGSTPSA